MQNKRLKVFWRRRADRITEKRKRAVQLSWNFTTLINIFFVEILISR